MQLFPSVDGALRRRRRACTRDAGRRVDSRALDREVSYIGGMSTESIRYTVALAVWTPPQTTDALFTLSASG